MNLVHLQILRKILIKPVFVTCGILHPHSNLTKNLKQFCSRWKGQILLFYPKLEYLCELAIQWSKKNGHLLLYKQAASLE